MAAAGHEREGWGEQELEQDRALGGEGPGASTRANVARPIAVSRAALFGALLSGLVGFMQGLAALAAFGGQLERLGFFPSLAIESAFAGRSVLALILMTLAMAAVGALVWSVGALVWNRTVAAPTGDVQQRPFTP